MLGRTISRLSVKKFQFGAKPVRDLERLNARIRRILCSAQVQWEKALGFEIVEIVGASCGDRVERFIYIWIRVVERVDRTENLIFVGKEAWLPIKSLPRSRRFAWQYPAPCMRQ